MKNGADTEAERGIRCNILTDGKIATLVWQVVPSESCPSGHLSVQIPVAGLRQLRSAVHAAHVQVFGYSPYNVGVGHVDTGARNALMVTVDEDTDAPLPFMLKDDAALKVVKLICEDLRTRMDETEAANLPSAILGPRRGIIIPRR